MLKLEKEWDRLKPWIAPVSHSNNGGVGNKYHSAGSNDHSSNSRSGGGNNANHNQARVGLDPSSRPTPSVMKSSSRGGPSMNKGNNTGAKKGTSTGTGTDTRTSGGGGGSAIAASGSPGGGGTRTNSHTVRSIGNQTLIVILIRIYPDTSS